MAFVFQRAQRSQRKARVGLIGPSGSGKTYTALQLAKGLAGETGTIAVIDTENGSAALYADRFSFDVLVLETFAPQTYVEAIRAAEAAGYDVLIIDSLSHAWAGKGGALEMVDRVAKRMQTTNTFAAWREVTPAHNALVDALVRCKCHLICTMRAKTEYVVETDAKGKSVPRKVGLAPIQRDGMEYEFDIVADLDLDHNMLVSKTRYSPLTGAVINRPSEELGREVRAWLESGAPIDVPTVPAAAARPRTAAPAGVSKPASKAPAPAGVSKPASKAPAPAAASGAASVAADPLTEYLAAATAKGLAEAEARDFLRYADWKVAFDRHADGRGPEPLLPARAEDVPAKTVQSITKRLASADTEALRALLGEWRKLHANTEDPVPFEEPPAADAEAEQLPLGVG